MGAWGARIFVDDLAVDVRGAFEDALREGLSVERATRRVLGEYAEAESDPDEGPVVRLALAALQAERGRLRPEVRDEALAIIGEGRGLALWGEQGEEALAERRRAYEELAAVLASPEARCPAALPASDG